jgi:hypothetical protein
VVRVGTSKGSTISQYGCSTSRALATGALQKKTEFSICISVRTQQIYGLIRTVMPILRQLQYIATSSKMIVTSAEMKTLPKFKNTLKL